MTFLEFRNEMDSFYSDVKAEANFFKDQQIVADKLESLYIRFDNDEKLMANRVLKEWLLEDDPRRVYAMALIRHFKIRSLLPDLYSLIRRLEGVPGMHALADRDYAHDVIKKVESN